MTGRGVVVGLFSRLGGLVDALGVVVRWPDRTRCCENVMYAFRLLAHDDVSKVPRPNSEYTSLNVILFGSRRVTWGPVVDFALTGRFISVMDHIVPKNILAWK